MINTIEIEKELIRIRHQTKRNNSLLCESFIFPNETLFGKPVHKIHLALPTVGCRWAKDKGGCTICGFYKVTVKKNLSPEQLLASLMRESKKWQNLKGNIALILFTSGSFFDPREIDRANRKVVYRFIAADKRFVHVSFECRPAFINKTVLTVIKKELPDLDIGIAIGLETCNDLIRRHCLHKGYTFNDFAKAAKLIKQFDFKLKVNLLVKPPFLTEKEAIEDTIKSIKICQKLKTDFLFVSACFVEKDSMLYFLWKYGLYQPPKLWSILEIAKNIKPGNMDVKFGGFSAYPLPIAYTSNCERCSEQVSEQLKEFTRYKRLRKRINCDCKKDWLKLLQVKDRRGLAKRMAESYQIIKQKNNEKG